MYEFRLLCEVHEEYETNIKLAKQGYFVYDFALPLLLLHAFTFHSAENLANWLRICPRRQITVLDTHDGMGIDDISGLAPVSYILHHILQHLLLQFVFLHHVMQHFPKTYSMCMSSKCLQSVTLQLFLNTYNSA